MILASTIKSIWGTIDWPPSHRYSSDGISAQFLSSLTSYCNNVHVIKHLAVDPVSRLWSAVSLPKDTQCVLNRLFGVLYHPPTSPHSCVSALHHVESAKTFWSGVRLLLWVLCFVDLVVQPGKWRFLFVFNHSITQVCLGRLDGGVDPILVISLPCWFHIRSWAWSLVFLLRNSPWSGPVMLFRWSCL